MNSERIYREMDLLTHAEQTLNKIPRPDRVFVHQTLMTLHQVIGELREHYCTKLAQLNREENRDGA